MTNTTVTLKNERKCFRVYFVFSDLPQTVKEN